MKDTAVAIAGQIVPQTVAVQTGNNQLQIISLIVGAAIHIAGLIFTHKKKKSTAKA